MAKLMHAEKSADAELERRDRERGQSPGTLCRKIPLNWWDPLGLTTPFATWLLQVLSPADTVFLKLEGVLGLVGRHGMAAPARSDLKRLQAELS